ncbi:hypothetical protein TorRG33x02_338140, partial [Trema orientale]
IRRSGLKKTPRFSTQIWLDKGVELLDTLSSARHAILSRQCLTPLSSNVTINVDLVTRQHIDLAR